MIQSKATKILYFITCFLGGLFLFSVGVQAETIEEGLALAAGTGLGTASPMVIIVNIIRVLLGFLGIIAVILILYAGFIMMTSEGSEEKVNKAKDVLKSAFIGLLIILSAFGIATFIINALASATGAGGDATRQRQLAPTWSGGSGVVGVDIVKTVYPEPFAKDIPMNTSILVTFREAIDLDSLICNNANNGDLGCNGTSQALTNNIRIYKKDDSCDNGSCHVNNVDSSNFVSAKATYSSDSFTIVIAPSEPLGVPGQHIDFEVFLKGGSDGIKKKTGEPAFTSFQASGYHWEFQTNGKMDWTPPQVKSIYPAADSVQDLVSFDNNVQATGAIKVKSIPNIAQEASAEIKSYGNNSNVGDLSGEYNCSKDGEILVSLDQGLNSSIGQVGQDPDISSIFVPGDSASDGRIELGCGIVIKSVGSPDDGSLAGYSWTIEVKAQKSADSIRVGDVTYVFVESGETHPLFEVIEITESSDINSITSKVSAKVNTNSLVSASANVNVNNNSVIIITAATPGSAGNNIVLSTSNTNTIGIVQMTGGADAEMTINRNGSPRDKDKNVTIKINFNEAINPITVTGSSEELKDYIRVVNASENAKDDNVECNLDSDCKSYKCSEINGENKCVGDAVDGKFVLSNMYKTVEFVASVVCGVNGCGEEVYCLPGNANLKVELVAAGLGACTSDDYCSNFSPFTECSPAASPETEPSTPRFCQSAASLVDPDSSYACTDDAQCANRGVYSDCSSDNGDSSGVCQTPTVINRPIAAIPLTGITDTALNSLDGDRDNNSEGPVSFYNLNYLDSGSGGDNFQWSFYTTDDVDLTAPVIESQTVAQGASSVNLDAPIEITFSKVMESRSLSTGQKTVQSPRGDVVHKFINLINQSGQPIGYWVTNEDIDTDDPLDGEADKTKVYINHTKFRTANRFKGQIGSGVRDINQNCFKPCKGPACRNGDTDTCTEATPSCCSGTAQANAECAR